MKRAFSCTSVLVVLGASGAAWGGPSLRVEAGPGQRAVTIAAVDGELRASIDRATLTLPVPPTHRASIDTASVSAIAIEGGRRVGLVTVTDPTSQQRWSAIVASKPGAPGPPSLLFAGAAPVDPGSPPPEAQAISVVRDEGKASVVVGDVSPEIGLCGRLALLSPRVVDPSDMTLKPAKLQRLSRAERDGAEKLTATRAEKGPAPLARLLHAIGASSGKGSPSALTDGDLETSWSEAKGGDGRGEFVTMRAPREVPITSLTFTVRPATRVVEHGAAPRRVYVAANQRLVEVTLPDDGFAQGGQAYTVVLAKPLASSCVAVVLDEAFDGEQGPRAAVTLTEVEARTALDGATDHTGLVIKLDGAEPEARVAVQMLVRGGEAALSALAAGFDKLGEQGKARALEVLEQAPCAASSRVVVQALASPSKAEVARARARLEACRREALPALLEAVASEAHPARGLAGEELSLIAPADALAPLLGASQRGDARRKLLGALGRAARNPRAQAALEKALADTSLAPRATLDLLRAAGPRAADPSLIAASSNALARLAGPTAPFDERYLAILPQGALAEAGDPRATAALSSLLSAPDHRLRAAAASTSGAVAPLLASVVALAADPEPRVREAVAQALARAHDQASVAALSRLTRDEWTFVRSAAYEALGAQPPGAPIDDHLLARLDEDLAPLSRAQAIEAIARRKIARAEGRLVALSKDGDANLDLRTRAVRALGAICAQGAVSRLTDLVKQGAPALAPQEQQDLAAAALYALGRLHPSDLDVRLAPALGEGSSRMMKAGAAAALREPERCPSR